MNNKPLAFLTGAESELLLLSLYDNSIFLSPETSEGFICST
nr:MAG TPA: AbrB family transcriptional regulator-like protein [Bacteriophage sp.]